jgi:hypothetical protein
VSTRKLILLALACGLAILVAGSIQLLRITNNQASTLSEGDTTELSTVRVTVVSSQVRGGSLYVVAHLKVASSAAAPLDDAGAGWSVLTGGLKEPTGATTAPDAQPPACVGLGIAQGQETDCTLHFLVDPRTPKSTFVTYRFVGDQATWAVGA